MGGTSTPKQWLLGGYSMVEFPLISFPLSAHGPVAGVAADVKLLDTEAAYRQQGEAKMVDEAIAAMAVNRRSGVVQHSTRSKLMSHAGNNVWVKYNKSATDAPRKSNSRSESIRNADAAPNAVTTAGLQAVPTFTAFTLLLLRNGFLVEGF